MTLGQIKERLQTREYDFLRTDEHLGRHFVAAFFLPLITLNMFGLLILGQNIIENHYHGQLASNRLKQFKHFKE